MTDVKRLLDEATPLPWESQPAGGYQGMRRWIRHGWSILGPEHLVARGYADSPDADARLIVHAVNRLPDYEAAVDALAILLDEEEDDDPAATRQAAREVLCRLREQVPA